MIYPYHCERCDLSFDVIKSVRQIDDAEICAECCLPAARKIAGSNLVAVCDWVESYNPSFGCVVKSKAHQRKILAGFKERGIEMEEVGNEPVEKIHKHFDRQREEKREQRWRDADRVMLYE